MKTIDINTATVAQLRFHAEQVLGLELSKPMNGGQVRAKILAAAPETTMIQAQDDAPASLAETEGHASRLTQAVTEAAAREARVDEGKAKFVGLSAKQAAAHHNDPLIEIFIPQSAAEGGKRDVPVAVGGVQFLIQRDVWTPVPYRVFEAMKNAEETIFEPGPPDDDGRMVPVSRNVPSYPFNYRNEPSDAEIEQWRRRTENVELA